MAGLLTRVDDAINPIVVKELRQAVKSRFVVSVLIIFLLLQLGWIAVQLLYVGYQGRMESLDFQGGRDVFMALQVILLGTCLLFVPVYTAVRLAAERNEANVDLLFVTTIQPRSIIAGKLFSAIVLAILIFSACMPFMGLTYYLRGIDWATILLVLGIDFLIVIVCVQFTVFLAVIPANLVFRALLGIFGLGCLMFVFGVAMSWSSMLLFFNVNAMGTSEFWYGLAGLVMVFAAIGGLFFSWSVALVSSPSSNRAFGVRLYMIALTVVSGLVAFGFSYSTQVNTPFLIWMWLATFLAAISTMIAINERREWSTRLTRRIPRSTLGRLVAFPLFSGAAGGIWFSVLLMASIAGAAFSFDIWSDEFLLHPRFGLSTRIFDLALEAAGQAFLYSYCYCLTALFVQRLFLPRLKTTFTWVVLLCLFALGMVLPYILLLVAQYDRWDLYSHSHWLLTNPFHALYLTMNADQGWIRMESRLFFWCFLVIWTAAATLFNLRWFGSQFRQFRRAENAPAPAAVPIGEAAP